MKELDIVPYFSRKGQHRLHFTFATSMKAISAAEEEHTGEGRINISSCEISCWKGNHGGHIQWRRENCGQDKILLWIFERQKCNSLLDISTAVKQSMLWRYNIANSTASSNHQLILVSSSFRRLMYSPWHSTAYLSLYWLVSTYLGKAQFKKGKIRVPVKKAFCPRTRKKTKSKFLLLLQTSLYARKSLFLVF